MVIHQEQCIGCGACVKDCLRGLFHLEGGKAVFTPGGCIDCGHCAALCPTGAVELRAGEKLIPYDEAGFTVPAENLLNLMRFRRSVRQFQAKPVEQAKLDALLEAGRYAPTGGNRQQTRFILLGKRQAEFTTLALKILHDTASASPAGALGRQEGYREKWKTLYSAWQERGEDGLFFHAPQVLLTVSQQAENSSGRVDAALASAYMELLAASMGLGVCYIGFFGIAAAMEPELPRRLGLRENETLVTTLALGYPNVKYYRTVERKPAQLTVL